MRQQRVDRTEDQKVNAGWKQECLGSIGDEKGKTRRLIQSYEVILLQQSTLRWYERLGRV